MSRRSRMMSREEDGEKQANTQGEDRRTHKEWSLASQLDYDLVMQRTHTKTCTYNVNASNLSVISPVHIVPNTTAFLSPLHHVSSGLIIGCHIWLVPADCILDSYCTAALVYLRHCPHGGERPVCRQRPQRAGNMMVCHKCSVFSRPVFPHTNKGHRDVSIDDLKILSNVKVPPSVVSSIIYNQQCSLGPPADPRYSPVCNLSSLVAATLQTRAYHFNLPPSEDVHALKSLQRTIIKASHFPPSKSCVCIWGCSFKPCHKMHKI